MSFRYYPAFIDLRGKSCVVLGGGRVAERKVLSLIKAGGRVKVISPTLTSALKKQRDRGTITHIERGYKKSDLRGAFIVIAATSDERINEDVSGESPCLVNIVDVPSLANFIVPSVVEKGLLTIAVSTSGASPAIASSIRKELESLYNSDFAKFLSFMKVLRKKALAEIPDRKARECFFRDSASTETLALLRRKGIKTARELVTRNYNAAKHRMSKATGNEKINISMPTGSCMQPSVRS